MALTGQIIYTIRNADGELLVFALVQTDNSYQQGAVPYILTPALFGLSQFAAKRAGAPGVNPFISPRVLGTGISTTNKNVILDVDDSVAAGPALRAFFPTGGAGAAPTTPATAPIAQAGANAGTSTAAQAAINPGRAQECPIGSDLSGLNPVLM